MRYMLDTCAFIDAVTEPDNLGADVCALMEDYENEFCISIETIREAILKFFFYKRQGLDLIYYGN